MPYYRYLTVTRDCPEENLYAGDLVEIALGTPEPIRSIRIHGHNHGRFLGLEADGILSPVDGVIGFPSVFSRPGQQRVEAVGHRQATVPDRKA